MSVSELAVPLVIGIVFIIIGWLIWHRKRLDLIAGYEKDTFDGDEKELALEKLGFSPSP